MICRLPVQAPEGNVLTELLPVAHLLRMFKISTVLSNRPTPHFTDVMCCMGGTQWCSG
jgi:hypothetical protein